MPLRDGLCAVKEGKAQHVWVSSPEAGFSMLM